MTRTSFHLGGSPFCQRRWKFPQSRMIPIQETPSTLNLVPMGSQTPRQWRRWMEKAERQQRVDPGRDDNMEPSFEDLAPAAGAMRTGFMSLDAVDFEDFFRRRAIVMKSVPRFLRGPFRSVLRIALQEALSPDVARRERGWKLLMAAPRMFLSKPPEGVSSAKRS